jgi:hypothetical protein
MHLQFIFHNSSFALVASLFFLWASIGLFHDTSLKREDLIAHSGSVVYIDSIPTIGGRHGTLKGKKPFLLRIVLHTEPSILFSATPLEKYGDFNFITSKINLGDQISIFTKPRLWKIFGLKRDNDISQLVKHNEVIVDYERFKEKVSGLNIFTALASIAFLFWYIRLTKQRIRKLHNVQ